MGIGIQSKVNQANLYLEEIDEQPKSIYDVMIQKQVIKQSQTQDFCQREIDRELLLSVLETDHNSGEQQQQNKISTSTSLFDITNSKLYKLLSFDRVEFIE